MGIQTIVGLAVGILEDDNASCAASLVNIALRLSLQQHQTVTSIFTVPQSMYAMITLKN
jgi:hypothetical protein